MDKVLILLGLSIISGILYRLGGSTGSFHGKERDWGCSICYLLALSLLTHVTMNLKTIAIYFLVFGLSWLMLSTYWKKNGDVQAKHWFFHGLGIGLACLPLIFIGFAWYFILLRAFVISILMTWISESTSNVWIEEIGRGFIIVITIPILLI